MKLLRFLGDSPNRLREFSANARQNAGFQLDKVQRGERLMIISLCHRLAKV